MRAIANPLQNLTTDSQYVPDYLKTIRGPVVLAGHSSGGAVITNTAAGLANVKALVYVDASAAVPGETDGQLSGSNSILAKDTPAQLFFTTIVRATGRASRPRARAAGGTRPLHRVRCGHRRGDYA